MTWFRFLLLLLLGAGLLAALLVHRGPVDLALERWVEMRQQSASEVARVAGASISAQEVARALRQRLFRQGLEWNALGSQEQAEYRRMALLELMDDLIIRAARQEVKADPLAVNAEVDAFIAEFHPRTEFQRRLDLQQMSEAALVNGITDRLADQAWLEKQLPEVEQTPAPAMETPEVWQVSHLFLSAHEKGKPDRSAEMGAIHAALLSGSKTFEALTAEHSEDERSKLRGGALGWISAQRTPADFMEAVRSQPVGKVGSPVRTKLGWHLIRVTDYQPARPVTDAEALPEWRATCEVMARQAAVEKLIQNLRAAHGGTRVIHEARLAKVLPLGYSVSAPTPPPSS